MYLLTNVPSTYIIDTPDAWYLQRLTPKKYFCGNSFYVQSIYLIETLLDMALAVFFVAFIPSNEEGWHTALWKIFFTFLIETLLEMGLDVFFLKNDFFYIIIQSV